MKQRTRPGKLDTRVQLQRKVRTPDGHGGNTIEWQTYRTMWAELIEKSGREYEHAQQLEQSNTSTFIIRNISDVLPDDRVLFGALAYNVRAIPPTNPRALYRTLECESGVAV